MKIMSVTMARNEADVLELFIRYHLRFIDHMVIILHGKSDDMTREIAYSLAAQGLPLTILTSDIPTHRQSYIVTQALLNFAVPLGADIALMLDCDEFLCSSSGSVREALEKLPDGHVLLAPWRTFVPFGVGASWQENMTHRRVQEEPGFSKVIIQRSFFGPGLTICQGSHEILMNGVHIPGTLHNRLWLAHVPIRSSEQAYRKARTCWPRQRDNPDRKGLDCFHWKTLYERASTVNAFTHQDLIELATTYSCTRHDVCSVLVHDNFMHYISLPEA